MGLSGITNPAEEYFKDGAWGYDGTQWRKLALLWGYTDRLAEQKLNLAATAGTNYLAHTAVPAGEVWVMTGGSVLTIGTATSSLLWLLVGATSIALYPYTPIASGIYKITDPLSIVLKAGDYIRASFSSCTEGDDIYSNIWGYKMAVA